MKPSCLTCLSFAIVATVGHDLRSQCAPFAIASNVLPGASSASPVGGGFVLAMQPWDPDGSGPRLPGIVVGGAITVAGSTAVRGVAFLDVQTGAFTELGDPAGTVQRLARGPQNQLYAAAGQRVSRWNGLQWVPLSLQIDGRVTELLALPNGDLILGGEFYFVDGVPCAGLARWNGSGWSAMGFAGGTSVRDVDRLPNGDLLVTGDLLTGSASGNLATVGNGTVTFVAGAPTGIVEVEVAAGGDLIASAAGSTPGIYRQSSGVWTSLTPQGSVGHVLHLAGNGDLYVGGNFTLFEGQVCNDIARFDGTAWHAVGAGVGPDWATNLYCLVEAPNGGIVAGGKFQSAGSQAAVNVARWDGVAWNSFGSGLDAEVWSVLSLPDGDTIVAGDFQNVRDANGGRCQRIARRSNGQWFAMGQGLDGRALTAIRMPNGDLVVGGGFQNAGGVAASNVARWDGSAWQALGAGINGVVNSLAVLPSGELLAGGAFGNAGGVPAGCMARWDGSAWHAAGNFNGPVESLCLRPNGQVLAGGWFTVVDGQPANHVAMGNGSSWSAVGTGVPSFVRTVVESPSLGVFASTGLGVHRFDGGQWAPFGPSPLQLATMRVLPDHSVLFGTFAIGAAPNTSELLRYDGAALLPWATLHNGSVRAMTVGIDDQVVCVGGFEHATAANGLVASAFVVQLASPCPAAQVEYGSGCASSGGTTHLAGVTDPWLGGVWRAVGTGLPAAAPFALQVIGSPGWPTQLNWLLPEGQPGCALMVDAILFDVVAINSGTSLTAWPVPVLPVLVGRQLAIQQLPFEFGQGGALIGVYATNALRATIGSY